MLDMAHLVMHYRLRLLKVVSSNLHNLHPILTAVHVKISCLCLFQAPASPPQNLTVTPVNSRSVHLSWSPPLREHYNGVIRQFWINITEVDTGRKTQMTSLGTSLTVPSLHPFYIYWFSVAAYTVDLGPFTEPLMLQMPQDGMNKINGDTTTLHSYINICFILGTCNSS